MTDTALQITLRAKDEASAQLAQVYVTAMVSAI